MEGVRRRNGVFVRDCIISKTGRVLHQATTWWFAFQGHNLSLSQRWWINRGSGHGIFFFSTRRDKEGATKTGRWVIIYYYAELIKRLERVKHQHEPGTNVFLAAS